MTSDADRTDHEEQATTNIPISDSAVGVQVSTETLVQDGTELPAVKICVGAGGIRGSVVMRAQKAEQVRDAIDRALKIG